MPLMSLEEARDAASHEVRRQLALLLGGNGEVVVAFAGHAPLVTTESNRHRSRRSGLHAAGAIDAAATGARSRRR